MEMIKKMKIKDKFNEVGLFTEMSKVGNLKFISEYLTAKQIDTLYNVKFGERLLACEFETMTCSEVAEIVYNSFANTWNKEFDLLATEIPLLKTFENTTTKEVNGTTDRKANITEQYEENSQVAGDNIEDYVNNDSNNSNRNNDTLEKMTNINKVSTTESGFKGDSYKLLRSAIDYLKVNLLYDIIMVDINDLITLNIF